MARYSDDLINQLKTNVDLKSLIASQGYQVTKQGKDYACRCPFHDDDTPSLIISPNSNLYHCFGCGAAGSVIDWVMKTQGLSFRHAVEVLKNVNTASPLVAPGVQPPATFAHPGASAAKTNTKKTVIRGTVRHLDNPLDSEADDPALMAEVIDYYHQCLLDSPEALDYLKKRGLDDEALIKQFKLGYANRTLAYRLPEKSRKEGEAIRHRLQEIGILRQSGHEHFNGSLIIPVIDQEGMVTEVYGRKIGERLRKGTPKHLYLPGPHQGIVNPSALNNHELILCESLIDALTFWRHGFHHVTTSFGTEGFTTELFEAINNSEVQRVLIAYDRDEAGDLAAKKVAEKLLKSGFDCYRVQLPKGMDVNEYALQGWSSAARGQESEAAALTMQPARKSLELVIRQAEWIGGMDAGGRATATPLAADTLATDNTETPESTIEAKEPQPLPASPQPEAKSIEIEAEVSENETVILLDNRRYRVRGLHKAMTYEQLKVNLAVSCGDQLHIDQVDLYNAKQRFGFIKQASVELGVSDSVIKVDLAKLLLKLEQLQDEQIKEKLQPKSQAAELSNQEQDEALTLLKSPKLLDQILSDLTRCGVVGEDTNKLMGYLACASRKLDTPLAVVIQSTSAAGKSSLMNAVLAMMPEEERIQYSAMTGQSLFYMGETNLKHKILAIAEEEGAQQASYALKLLQSEGELTIASTGKDMDGNLTTQEYRVEGPVMLFTTTTAIDIDEELMNRCMVLTVNESREQTELIHQMQRRKRTLEGLKDKADKKRLLTLHQNAQRLLRPLHIINPFADALTFLNDKTRTRRDHEKYLSLIDTIAFLHQYQRELKTTQHNGAELTYIEATLDDIAVANRLAHEVLGKTLSELPPQTRNLLGHIRSYVMSVCQEQGIKQPDFRFSRRLIREVTGWTDNQLKVHCKRLEELEYLLVHKGGRGQSIRYELAFDGDTSSDLPQLVGLIDVDMLKKQRYDDNKLGVNKEKMAPSCPQDGAVLASSWTEDIPLKPFDSNPSGDPPPRNGKTHVLGEALTSSYRSHSELQ